MKLSADSTALRAGATLALGMPVRAMCVALCWLVCGVASAQVSVVCRTPADRELAHTLARLIAQPVSTLDPALERSPAPTGDSVSIDREAATVSVYSVAHKTTLSRVLDADVLNSSPYAVALATAELLEFAGAPHLQVVDSHNAAASGAGGPQLAVGVELELQSQPGFELAFVRPALQLELAWGREHPGGFWTLALRGAGPGVRTLQVSATAAPGASARIHALSADAVAQLGFGHAFGRLALLTELAGGISYLQLAASALSGQRLGRDSQLSPLFAAGVGFRYSVLFGLALAVRAEAQWAGSPALYRIAGEPVLETGALRVSLFAGVVWEGALAQSR